MKSLTRLTVLVVVLVGLTLATGVAYAGQFDQQLSGIVHLVQGTSAQAQDLMDIGLRNNAAQQKSSSSSTMDDDEIEIVGIVTGITTDTITVSDTVIAITPETEFKDEVAVGDMVKVEAFYADDGTLTARKVELFEQDDGEVVTIIGVLTSITTDTITVSDTVIAITPETEFEDEVAVGDMVKVKAFYADGGTLTALKVELFEEDGSGPGYGYDEKVMIVGVVESFSSDSIVVSGIPISITAQTKIVGDIQVGDTVKVHAFLADDGTLTAWKIKWLPDAVSNPGHGDKTMVIGGIVESLSSDTIVVSGIGFAISSETVFDGDIGVGDRVKVLAYTAEDGTVTVRKVTLLKDGSGSGTDASPRGGDNTSNRSDRSGSGSGDQSQSSGGSDKGGGGSHGGGSDKGGGNGRGGGRDK